MFLRAAALTTFMVGLSLASAGTTMAQFLPPLPLPGASPAPMRQVPPAVVDNDNDLPPYDPPPGYRRPAPAPMASSAPTSRRRSRRPVRTAPRPAIRRGASRSIRGRDRYIKPPPGQYGAAPGYPPGQPAYDPPPGYQEPRGPVGRPQYGAAPPQQDDVYRPPLGVGPGGQQPGDPTDITSRLPTDDRPETGPRKELPAHSGAPRSSTARASRPARSSSIPRTRLSISCSATARRSATASASAAKASPGPAPSASRAWPNGRTGIRRRK